MSWNVCTKHCYWPATVWSMRTWVRKRPGCQLKQDLGADTRLCGATRIQHSCATVLLHNVHTGVIQFCFQRGDSFAVRFVSRDSPVFSWSAPWRWFCFTLNLIYLRNVIWFKKRSPALPVSIYKVRGLIYPKSCCGWGWQTTFKYKDIVMQT